MKNTSLLCLSSPADDANYYSTLMGLKRENGDPFFIVVDCFQICLACQKLEREKQILCTHIKSTTPWLSSRKIRDLKALYKSSPEDAIREFGGMVMSDHLPALCKEEVAKAFARERVTTQAPPKYIFTSADPTGGGPSQLAMCSGYYTALNDFVVIGLDSEPIRDEREEKLLLMRHYEKIRQHPMFKQSRHIFIPESNLGMESHHMEAMVMDIPGVTTFWENEKKPGICKTARSTREYQFLLTTSLSMGGIRFDNDLFTATREKTAGSMMNMLQEQMLRYHWSVKAPNDEFSKEKVTLTGKVGSLQDDLVITLAQNLYVGRMIMMDPGRLNVQGRR